MKFDVLVWDRQNLEHIARHWVHKDEVEEVLDRYYQVRLARKGRYTFRGHTYAGRYLFIVVDALGERRGYVVTAREMTEAEKHQFRKSL